MTTSRFPQRSSAWTATPERVTTDIPGGKVTGQLTVRWTSATTAYVSTNGAHVNDDNPAVTFRGRDYLASIHLKMEGGGVWTAYSQHVTDRARWTDAPRTFADAIATAAAATLTAMTTPEILREASRANDLQRRDRASSALEAAERELSEAQARVAAIRAELAELAARLGD